MSRTGGTSILFLAGIFDWVIKPSRMSIRTSILFCAGTLFWCLMMYVNASADVPQLERLRYSSESDYTRVVLDLSAAVASHEVIRKHNKQLTLRLQPCRSNPAIPATHTNLDSELMKQIQFEASDGDVLLMHIQLKVASNARVFTMDSPDRIVMDLRPVIPIEAPSITPDPTQAVPLQVDPDPLDQIIQTVKTQKQEPKQTESNSQTEALATMQSQKPDSVPGQGRTTVSPSEPAPSVPSAQTSEDPEPETQDQPETPKLGSTQMSGRIVEQAESDKESESLIPPLRTTDPVKDRWSFSNPWLISQLMLDLFLVSMILLLFRHAQKLNSSLLLMRVKLKGLEQNRARTTDSEHHVQSAHNNAVTHPQPQTLPEQPLNAAADFDQLVQPTTPEVSDIRTATAHGRARQQSQQKKRTELDSTPRQATDRAVTDRQPTHQTLAPSEPRPERSLARQTSTKKGETATEDLSFDELRNALSKISRELDRLIDAEDAPEASVGRNDRESPRSQSRPATMSERSVREQVVDLANREYDAIEISRELEIPRGEVELILSLHNEE